HPPHPPIWRSDQSARVACKPKRNGDLAFRAGFRCQRFVQHWLKTRRGDPLCHSLRSKSQAPMRKLFAQEFLFVRCKVDYQQASARTQNARRLVERGGAVVEEV